MRTAKLEEIVRQRDAALKQVVEQLAEGKVGEAVQGLERQGRVHEVTNQAERITAIAKEYARQPENTLVVSPDSRDQPGDPDRAARHRRGQQGRAPHRYARAPSGPHRSRPYLGQSSYSAQDA